MPGSLKDIVKLMFLLWLMLLLSACDERLPIERFPDVDIVYNYISDQEPGIGFVDIDGQDNQIVHTSDRYGEPYWSESGKRIYLLQTSGVPDGGRITIWEEGKRMRTCWRWRFIESIGGFLPEAPDRLAVVIIDAQRIALIDVERCKEIKEYYAASEDEPVWLGGASLSPDGTRLAYYRRGKIGLTDFLNQPGIPALKYTIEVIDLATGEIQVLAWGANPSWSPDGRQIAYTSVDGIYLINPDGTRQRRVKELDFYEDATKDLFAPTPRWSPDGKWLVYHRYDPRGTRVDKDARIYVLNLDSGQEVGLDIVGYEPFWRAK